MFVAAVNGAGEGITSNQTNATPQAPITIPNAPASLTATGGNSKVDLSWSSVTNATSYTVKKSTTAGGPYTEIATTSAITYGDTSVTNGTKYYYVVTAVNAAGSGPNSNEGSATPQAPITTPDAPASLTATGDNARVDL